eukprot:3620777-Pleurochrysis_carterae.AAC.4
MEQPSQLTITASIPTPAVAGSLASAYKNRPRTAPVRRSMHAASRHGAPAPHFALKYVGATEDGDFGVLTQRVPMRTRFVAAKTGAAACSATGIRSKQPHGDGEGVESAHSPGDGDGSGGGGDGGDGGDGDASQAAPSQRRLTRDRADCGAPQCVIPSALAAPVQGAFRARALHAPRPQRTQPSQPVWYPSCAGRSPRAESAPAHSGPDGAKCAARPQSAACVGHRRPTSAGLNTAPRANGRHNHSACSSMRGSARSEGETAAGAFFGGVAQAQTSLTRPCSAGTKHPHACAYSRASRAQYDARAYMNASYDCSRVDDASEASAAGEAYIAHVRRKAAMQTQSLDPTFAHIWRSAA